MKITPDPEIQEAATAPLRPTAPPKPKTLRHAWFWLLVVLVVGGIAYATYARLASTTDQAAGGPKGFGPGDHPIPVATATARTGDIDIFLEGLGTVTPLKTATVRSRVEGQLMRVPFKEGQLVKEGDLLAEIDPRPFQVQLAQAEGQLVRDQALLANARLDLDRYRTLFDQDSIAKQQVDTQASLVRQYEGAIKVDQSQVDNARLQLTYARVTAPISGRLGLRQVDPGNVVRASDANGLVVITQLAPITVVFTLPQDKLPDVMRRLASGDRLLVDAYDREKKTRLAQGTLLTVDNQIDPTTGTVKLKAEFPNTDAALFPNQFVNVRMLLDTRHDVTTIPVAAVQRGSEGTFVYAVTPEQTVALRPIKLATIEGDTAMVESGVAPGDVVVVDGADRLREGTRVDVDGRSAQRAPTGDAKPGTKPGGNRRRNGPPPPP
ncbi:MAG: MdtA/MuxA family multidrug efflux RND transporter periplasmic adaptor subunit [Betaproteobacteria bacterium]|nr:MdtA/MuxA family multidrug efflux RND transporter periplasmic adaptor subunit [Betaproteobacteria bacterium]